MTLTRFANVPQLIAIGIVGALACRALATPVIDATNNAGPSSSALTVAPSNFRAQSFTITNDGLLSTIDVQVGKASGATGNITLQIRPMVSGLPGNNDRSVLYSTVIDINTVPVINSLSDPPPFISVDVSAAGIHAKPGEKYAVNLLRSGSSPNASWRTNTTNTYTGGNGFFRSLTTSAWSATTNDYGFRTWVDPTPTAPYKLRVDPTVDISYRPGTNPTLIEGEGVLYVGGFPGDTTFPEQRPIMEFPIGALPAGAIISGAHLELQWNGSSGEPQIEIIGYAGDGIGGFNDVTVTGTLLTTTPATSAADSNIVPIDPTYLTSLVGHASHIGMRLRSLDLPEYIGFYTTEYPFTSILPPRLVIDYTLPTTLPGDFNADGKVNGADYVAWRNNDGTPTGYTQWRSNFGATAASGSLTDAVVPEPASVLLLLCAAAIPNRRRR